MIEDIKADGDGITFTLLGPLKSGTTVLVEYGRKLVWGLGRKLESGRRYVTYPIFDQAGNKLMTIIEIKDESEIAF